MIVVIKIGSNVLASEEGAIDTSILKELVLQVVLLQQQGHQCVMISSGTVLAGKQVQKQVKGDALMQRQVYAALGQIPLMNLYTKYFAAHNMLCGQMLVTKEDFRDREHYLYMRSSLEGLLENNIIPILNENDAIAVHDRGFSDNDELAGLVAAMLHGEMVCILSSVDGVYTDINNKEILNEITLGMDIAALVHDETSTHGRGGMYTKLTMAIQLARLGVSTTIACGKRKGILLDIVEGKEVGTRIVGQKQLSNVKRWIAHKKGIGNGRIFLTKEAEEVLRAKDEPVSILPIGIALCEGSFEKGDIIEICSYDGRSLGGGKAAYGKDTLLPILGKRNQKYFIHYDYLFLSL